MPFNRKRALYLQKTTSIAMLAMAGTAFSANAATTRWYRFETNDGSAVSDGQTLTSADDSSGNNRTGVPFGTPKFGLTPFSNPLPATGAANQFSLVSAGDGVSISGDSAPVLGPTFTVEAYFRLSSTDPATGDAKTILRVRNATLFPFELSVLNLDGNGGTDDLLLEMSNDTLELHCADLALDMNYHVAATYDGLTAKLYLDGTLISSGTDHGFTGTGTIRGAIGNDPELGGAPFQGNIDEFRISDAALSPAQFLDAVPEPASLSLIGLSCTTLLARRRRW